MLVEICRCFYVFNDFIALGVRQRSLTAGVHLILLYFITISLSITKTFFLFWWWGLRGRLSRASSCISGKFSKSGKSHEGRLSREGRLARDGRLALPRQRK